MVQPSAQYPATTARIAPHRYGTNPQSRWEWLPLTGRVLAAGAGELRQHGPRRR